MGAWKVGTGLERWWLIWRACSSPENCHESGEERRNPENCLRIRKSPKTLVQKSSVYSHIFQKSSGTLMQESLSGFF